MSVIDGKDLIFDIGSTREAAEFLVLHWPEKYRGSWPHVRAQTACLDVLQELREPDFARQAFLEAAWEAGITVENP